MTLELFKSQGSGFEFCGVSLRRTQVLVSQSFFKLLGKPKFVKFFFDKEANAIAVSVEQTGGEYVYATVLHKKSVTVNCVLGKTMPQGRYIYQSQNELGLYILTFYPLLSDYINKERKI